MLEMLSPDGELVPPWLTPSTRRCYAAFLPPQARGLPDTSHELTLTRIFSSKKFALLGFLQVC